MIKRLICMFLFFSLLFGCSSIQIDKSAANIKKLAVISIYMNYNFYDVNPKKEEKKNHFNNKALNILEDIVTDIITLPEIFVFDQGDGMKERNEILDYALQIYSKQISSLGKWELIPVDSVLDYYKKSKFNNESSLQNEKLQAEVINKQIDSSEYIAATGMEVVQIEDILRSRYNIFPIDFNRSSRIENTKKSLSQLAREIGVDGVLIVKLDMGYSRDNFVFSSLETEDRPDISLALAIITKDGDVAVKVNTGERFEGEGTLLVTEIEEGDTVDTKDAVIAYKEAVKKSAMSLKESLAESLK
jgi:hypothetical protein